MIKLTPEAVAKVKEFFTPEQIETVKKEILEKDPATKIEEIGLRIGVQGGGCSGLSYMMKFDMKRPDKGDTVYEFDGLKVFVDQISAIYIEGVEIDYVEQMDGSGFRFNNPNVKAQCGCGSSFTA